jgi:competence protein ComEC
MLGRAWKRSTGVIGCCSSAEITRQRSGILATALMVACAGGCDSGSSAARPLASTTADVTGASAVTSVGGSEGSPAVRGGGSGTSELGGVDQIVGGLSGAGATPGTIGEARDGGRTPGPSADAAAPISGTLTFYFVDSEGGQSTIAQLPNGQILVIDTGNPGMRDGERMLAVLRDELGAARIDYLIITHYDSDHVGGVPYLAARVGIDQYFDHGDTNAPAQYLALANASARRSVVAGDVLNLGGVSAQVVSAGGTVIREPLPGGGAPNPLCEGAQAALPGDPLDENVNSVGVVIRFGNFDFLDLGDLLWPREHELACPNHQIGPVDLYLTTHHGLTRSGAPQLVRGAEPLAAVMNNGPRKGGGGSTWDTLELAPGGENVWQVHRAVAAPADQNAPTDQIANLDEGQADSANYLKVIVESSGKFSIVNPRTTFSKTYSAR